MAAEVSAAAASLAAQFDALKKTLTEHQLLALEMERGGRDEMLAWVNDQIKTWPMDVYIAFRWALFDQRREIFEDPAGQFRSALEELKANFDAKIRELNAWDEKHQIGIDDKRIESGKRPLADYYEFARQAVERFPNDPSKANAAFESLVKGKKWPTLDGRTRRRIMEKVRGGKK